MTNHHSSAVLETPIEPFVPDEAELAAVAFLARYSGRTLEAYRHDLRNLFQWAADHSLPVLEATRAHLELYRASMEDRGLAASTIDRRLSTACGFYRFAHIDGRITSNPASWPSMVTDKCGSPSRRSCRPAMSCACQSATSSASQRTGTPRSQPSPAGLGRRLWLNR
jgi:hypothetical protein